jgi:hypothetical protein
MRQSKAGPCPGFVLLSTNAQVCNQCTVLDDVVALKVLKQTFALGYHHDEAATGCVVLLEFVEMLRKAFDAEGKKCDLAFDGTGIVLATAILGEDFLLLL